MSHARQERGRALTFGHDRALLETRGLLLEADGYVTDLASTLGELQALLRAGTKYDIVVLCHTVTEAERSAIRSEVQGLAQPVPLYAIAALAPPREFVQQVSRLTGNKALVTRGWDGHGTPSGDKSDAEHRNRT